MYLWAPEGASCVHIPMATLGAASVAWSPAGGCFAVSDRDAFCCAYLAWTPAAVGGGEQPAGGEGEGEEEDQEGE